MALKGECDKVKLVSVSKNILAVTEFKSRDETTLRRSQQQKQDCYNFTDLTHFVKKKTGDRNVRAYDWNANIEEAYQTEYRTRAEGDRL